MVKCGTRRYSLINSGRKICSQILVFMLVLSMSNIVSFADEIKENNDESELFSIEEAYATRDREEDTITQIVTLETIDSQPEISISQASSAQETIAKKVYLKNLNDLIELSNQVNSGNQEYITADCYLTEDIIIKGNFIPIGNQSNIPFKGTFTAEGGHKITVDSRTSTNFSGLFGFVENAALNQIAIIGSTIRLNNPDSGGTLVYRAVNSTITNCYIKGNVIIDINSKVSGYAGGLVGIFENLEGGNGYITDCYIDGNVTVNFKADTGSLFVGGLIGQYKKQSIGRGSNFSNCYINGNVTVNGTTESGRVEVGGLVGDYINNGNEGSVINCSISGKEIKVTGKTSEGQEVNVGGLFGSYIVTNNTIENCSIKGNIKIESTTSGGKYPNNKANAGGIIGLFDAFSPESSSRVALASMKGCKIEGNVNILSTADKGIGISNAGGLIGTQNVLSSNNNSNLVIMNSGISGSTQVRAKTITASGNTNAGGIAGLVVNLGNTSTNKISGCYLKGGSIIEAVNTAEFEDMGSNAGSLVGHFKNNGRVRAGSSIDNCYAMDSINIKASSKNAFAYAGGLIGWIMDSITTTADSQVSNCYIMSIADITAQKTGTSNANFGIAGGLIGASGTPVTLSGNYSAGKVTGTNYCGGILGYAAKQVKIENCVSLNQSITVNKSAASQMPAFSGKILGYSKVMPDIKTSNAWAEMKLSHNPGIEGVNDSIIISKLNGIPLSLIELENPERWPSSFKVSTIWSHKSEKVPAFVNATINPTAIKTILGKTTGGDGNKGGGGTSSGGGGSSSSSGVNSMVWKQDKFGWWLERQDKTYPKSQWIQKNSIWYYFDSSGYMATGWREINGLWYYLRSSGSMIANDWVFSNNHWYYLNGDGSMKLGWQEWKGSWYYLNSPNGEMAVDTVTQDGYVIGKNGIWIP